MLPWHNPTAAEEPKYQPVYSTDPSGVPWRREGGGGCEKRGAAYVAACKRTFRKPHHLLLVVNIDVHMPPIDHVILPPPVYP